MCWHNAVTSAGAESIHGYPVEAFKRSQFPAPYAAAEQVDGGAVEPLLAGRGNQGGSLKAIIVLKRIRTKQLNILHQHLVSPFGGEIVDNRLQRKLCAFLCLSCIHCQASASKDSESTSVAADSRGSVR